MLSQQFPQPLLLFFGHKRNSYTFPSDGNNVIEMGMSPDRNIFHTCPLSVSLCNVHYRTSKYNPGVSAPRPHIQWLLFIEREDDEEKEIKERKKAKGQGGRKLFPYFVVVVVVLSLQHISTLVSNLVALRLIVRIK